MKFEIEILQMDFGDTPIENIFLNDFMPQADGNFVKVYLAGYQMAQSGLCDRREVEHGDIARRLNLLESDVLRAWDYWESQGIIKKKYEGAGEDYGIIFLSLKELYTKNIYTGPKKKEEPQLNMLSDPVIANLFSQASYYMRRDLPYQNKREIASWIDTYNMGPELIIEAFRYGTEVKGKRSLAYIEGIVRNWADENVRTKEALEENFRTHEESYYFYNKVMKLSGIESKGNVEEDKNRIWSWHQEMGLPLQLIEEAAKRTGQRKNPNLNYMETILRAWKEKGILTVADLPKDTPPVREKSRKNIDNARTDTYSNQSLDDMAERKWQSFIDKKGRGR